MLCFILNVNAFNVDQTASVKEMFAQAWERVSHDIHEKWDKFTPDELNAIKADPHIAIMLLETKYQMKKQTAQEEWRSFLKEVEIKEGEREMKWESVKKAFKEKWHKFTEEDLTHVKKAYEEHVSQPAHQAKEATKAELKNASAEAKEATHTGKEKVKSGTEVVIDKLAHYYHYSRDEAQRLWDEFKQHFK